MLLVWLPQFQLGDVDVSRQRSAEKKPASVTAETRPVPVGRRRASRQQSAEKKPTVGRRLPFHPREVDVVGCICVERAQSKSG